MNRFAGTPRAVAPGAPLAACRRRCSAVWRRGHGDVLLRGRRVVAWGRRRVRLAVGRGGRVVHRRAVSVRRRRRVARRSRQVHRRRRRRLRGICWRMCLGHFLAPWAQLADCQLAVLLAQRAPWADQRSEKVLAAVARDAVLCAQPPAGAHVDHTAQAHATQDGVREACAVAGAAAADGPGRHARDILAVLAASTEAAVTAGVAAPRTRAAVAKSCGELVKGSHG